MTETVINLKDAFALLQVDLERLKIAAEKVSNTPELQLFISKQCYLVITNYISKGDTAKLIVENQDSSCIKEAYALNYVLPEQYKSFALLCRDIYVQIHKASILETEQVVSKNQIDSHFTASKSSIIQAISSFYNQSDLDVKNALLKMDSNEKIIKKTELYNNPWLVYKDQLGTILSQLKVVETSYHQLQNSASIFFDIKDVISKLKHNTEQLLHSILKDITYLKDETVSQTTSKRTYIESALVSKLKAGNNLTDFSEQLAIPITSLQIIKAPIDLKGAQLVIREVDVKSSVQKWVDYSLLPELMDVLTLENNIKSKTSISFTHLKNRLEFDKNQTGIPQTELNSFLENLETQLKPINEQLFIKLNDLVESANKSLKISRFVKGKTFLEVPINSAISHRGESLLIKLKSVINNRFSVLSKSYKEVIQNSQESELLQVTACISSRMYKDTDEHYDALFLSKKFIGNLFLVPRVKQERLVRETVEQWRSGFAKSILIYGNRLTGKTTFLDYVSKLNFNQHIVKLQPNSTAIIDGRKFSTSCNLKEALGYIKNNNIKSTRPIVVIDNLEYWGDTSYSVLENTRALLHFIENESDEIMVMASTSTIMYHHLNTRFNFSTVFSLAIDISRASRNEIHDSIMLRHGAAQRTLVNYKNENMSAYHIHKAINKLASKYDYNLGEVLQSWTHHTFVKDNNNLLFKESIISLPEFFTVQENVILKQALLFKTITEFGLKKVTANGFEAQFKSALKRLINTKILLRNDNGDLIINPVVVFDVETIMNSKTI